MNPNNNPYLLQFVQAQATAGQFSPQQLAMNQQMQPNTKNNQPVNLGHPLIPSQSKSSQSPYLRQQIPNQGQQIGIPQGEQPQAMPPINQINMPPINQQGISLNNRGMNMQNMQQMLPQMNQQINQPSLPPKRRQKKAQNQQPQQNLPINNNTSLPVIPPEEAGNIVDNTLNRNTSEPFNQIPPAEQQSSQPNLSPIISNPSFAANSRFYSFMKSTENAIKVPEVTEYFQQFISSRETNDMFEVSYPSINNPKSKEPYENACIDDRSKETKHFVYLDDASEGVPAPERPVKRLFPELDDGYIERFLNGDLEELYAIFGRDIFDQFNDFEVGAEKTLTPEEEAEYVKTEVLGPDGQAFLRNCNI